MAYKLFRSLIKWFVLDIELIFWFRHIFPHLHRKFMKIKWSMCVFRFLFGQLPWVTCNWVRYVERLNLRILPQSYPHTTLTEIHIINSWLTNLTQSYAFGPYSIYLQNLVMWEILQGASTADQATIPEGTEQIFVMSQNVYDAQKEDLAWATYILLRNTNTIAAVYHCIIIYHLWNQTIKRGPCKKVGGGTWVYDYQVLMRHQFFFLW